MHYTLPYLVPLPVLLLVLAAACTPAGTVTPTASPTATSSPTAQAQPEPTPYPVAELTDAAMTRLRQLVEGLGPRQSATPEEEAAAEFLAQRFTSLGYSTELQPFTVETLSPERSGLFLEDSGEKIEVAPLAGSAFEEVSGQLTPAGLGREQDIPPGGLAGQIALVERGQVRFGDKVRRAAEAGAVGVVVYNNQAGNFRGSLGYQASIPAVSISRADGQRLVSMASEGTVEATLALTLEDLPSQNVIAEKPGSGQGVVVLGGHYDTVSGVAGANDNASGTAVLLTLAEELKNHDFPFTVRVIAFGSEEVGLVGSRFYVDSLSSEEREELRAMLNFDALGSGDLLELRGRSTLTDLASDLAEEMDVPARVGRPSPGATSDHASFAGAGVPVLMFSSSDPSRIHTPEDTLEHIDPQRLGGAAALALAVLDSLAEEGMRPDGEPPGVTPARW